MTEAQVALVESHMHLVPIIVGRLICEVPLQNINRQHSDRDDMLADGYLGLVRAAIRFNSQSGVLFSTYAWHRIMGAVKDGLRRDGLSMRSGRIQRSYLSWRDAKWVLLSDTGPSAFELYEANQTRARVRAAAERLSGRERAIVAWMLDDEEPATVCRRMGRSYSRMSQIRASAYHRMSEWVS